ncbi:TetR/AcrR family transcriptional regulator [Lacticaseibacillus saniviri]
MVSKTFESLHDDKKARVTSALLTEFSTYSLDEAQVARIVKDADIARGAFYKYFDDLADAYRYIYGVAMQDIHAQLRPQGDYDAQTYLDQVEQFVDQVQDSQYYALIQQHFTNNTDRVTQPNLARAEQMTSLASNVWAASILSHETIKQIMLYPELKSALLQQLQRALISLGKD